MIVGTDEKKKVEKAHGHTMSSNSPISSETNVPLKLPVPEGLQQSTHIFVYGSNAVKDVPASALSPLSERMGV